MKTMKQAIVILMMLLAGVGRAQAAGSYYKVEYSTSTAPGGLRLAVNYTMWLPEGTRTLRGVIVHQHGCGAPACQSGAQAAYDLHWQALAKKWDCALLGPSYQQAETQDCVLWCDPRLGSDGAFLKALDDLAAKSGHPELASVPWCLWGHSGGGVWVSLMQARHPGRVVAAWLRSGAWPILMNMGRIPRPEIPDAIYAIPTMINPGIKEKTDRFKHVWDGSWPYFQEYRARGALIGFAPDPRTSHECGDSRYLAIPFFDACLAQRLPERGSTDQALKPMDGKLAWLAEPLGKRAVPAGEYRGKKEEAVWLPDARMAQAWSEYVKRGSTGDTTPPPAPFNVRVSHGADGTAELTWDAEADFESGLGGFIIRRDGRVMARLPEKPVGQYGRPLFQRMSYHDTPERPLPEMRYVDKGAGTARQHVYTVIALNSIGLRSGAAQAAEDNERH